MCFSPEVSFASAAALVPVGLWCLGTARKKAPQLWPIAVVPIVFGIQQASEGLVWLAIQGGHSRLGTAAGLAYLFFAIAFWPVWFSTSAVMIEPQIGRRHFLSAWAVVSTGWFWLGYLPVLTDPNGAASYVYHHSIRYERVDGFVHDPLLRWTLRVLYVLTSSIPLLVSSWRRVLMAPVLLGVGSAAVAALLYDHAFTSVWCLWSAVLSVAFAVSIATAGSAKEKISVA